MYDQGDIPTLDEMLQDMYDQGDIPEELQQLLDDLLGTDSGNGSSDGNGTGSDRRRSEPRHDDDRTRSQRSSP